MASDAFSRAVYSRDDLVSRLIDAHRRQRRRLAFCVGSAITASVVPGVAAAVDLMRDTLVDSDDDLRTFDLDVGAGRDGAAYQAAASLVLARRGQDVLNGVVRRMALTAHRPTRDAISSGALSNDDLTDEFCLDAEQDLDGWDIPPAAEAVARLLVHRAAFIAGPVLTTNFDPLIELAVRREGGYVTIESLDADGRISPVEAPSGVRVVHLHGYWRKSDTLHVPVQLRRERGVLQASLEDLLRERTLFVIGYGGWDDVFTSALARAVEQQRQGWLDVLWSFYEGDADAIASRYDRLLNHIGDLPGRISLYAGIDCATLLPEIAESYGATAAPPPPVTPSDESAVIPPVALFDEGEALQQLLVDLDTTTKLFIVGSSAETLLATLVDVNLPSETVVALSPSASAESVAPIIERQVGVFSLRRRLRGEPYRVDVTDQAAYVLVRHPVSGEVASIRYANGTLQYDMMTRFVNRMLSESDVQAAA